MAYSQETADLICAQLAEGKSLRSICSQPGMPSHSAFLVWVRERPELAHHYARAREIGDEIEFERLEELIDEPPPNDANGKTDAAWVTWQRNRIDVRKWSLAKKQPKKYGDKLALGGADDLPPIKTMTDEQLAARVKALQDKLSKPES